MFQNLTIREKYLLIVVGIIGILSLISLYIHLNERIVYSNELAKCYKAIKDWNEGNNVLDVWGENTLNVSGVGINED